MPTAQSARRPAQTECPVHTSKQPEHAVSTWSTFRTDRYRTQFRLRHDHGRKSARHRNDQTTAAAIRGCNRAKLTRCAPRENISVKRGIRSRLQLVSTAGSPRPPEDTQVENSGNMAKRILAKLPQGGGPGMMHARSAAGSDGGKNPYGTINSTVLCDICNSRIRMPKKKSRAGGLTDRMPGKFRVRLNLLHLTIC